MLSVIPNCGNRVPNRPSYCSNRGQYSTTSMDLTRFQDTTHAHDLTQGLSRVVMVRKMERRIFINSPKNGQVSLKIIFFHTKIVVYFDFESLMELLYCKI